MIDQRHGFLLDTVTGKYLGQKTVMDGSRGCPDPWQRRELGPSGIGDPLFPAHRGDDAIGELRQLQRVKWLFRRDIINFFGGAKIETKINCSTFQFIKDFATDTMNELGNDPGMVLFQTTQQLTEADEFGVHNGANPQRARDLSALRTRTVSKFGHGGQNLLGLGQQRFAIRSQVKPMWGAFEQGDPGLLTQSLDLVADGWLGKVQDIGRAGNAALSGDRNKGEDTVEIGESFHITDFNISQRYMSLGLFSTAHYTGIN